MRMNARRRHVMWLTVWCMGAMPPLMAWEIETLQTHYDNGEYRLEMNMRLAAPKDSVETVIRDYEHYGDLDGRILEARVLERAAGGVLLFTRLNACFGFFCRKVDRVEEVREQPGELYARTLPERSDVERGSTETRLIADGGHTRVQYTTRITPKFWVPPLFGRSWMLRSLQEATTALFINVEARAQALPAAAP